MNLEANHRVLERNGVSSELRVVLKDISDQKVTKTGRVKKARKLGAGKYIRKPYSLDRIGAAIRYQLDR